MYVCTYTLALVVMFDNNVERGSFSKRVVGLEDRGSLHPPEI